jgi:hypothetical protein
VRKGEETGKGRGREEEEKRKGRGIEKEKQVHTWYGHTVVSKINKDIHILKKG